MTVTSAPGDTSAEGVVALTDFALGVEAAVLGMRLARRRSGRTSPLRGPLVTFFAATAIASTAGAALHGLTTDRSDPRRRALWRVSLGAIGLAALSSWWLAARLALGRRGSRIVTRGATILHVPYFAAVLGTDRPFRFAITSYLPGAFALGGALALRLRDPRRRPTAAIALGALGVTFAAAGVQVARIGLTRRFDHNALYHSLQALGVALFYRASTGLLESTPQPTGRH